MAIRAEDRGKAILLVVAILAVLVFALRPLIFRSAPTPAPSAVASATNPTPDPLGTPPADPDVRVDPVTTETGSVAPPANPFRKTVATKSTYDAGNPGSSQVAADGAVNRKPPPTGLDGKLPDGPGVNPLPATIPEELEFRLEGVMVGGRSLAVVRRGGELQYLRVGNPAAYGYRIASITPIGIRVVQKGDSRWIKVGEIFRIGEPAVG